MIEGLLILAIVLLLGVIALLVVLLQRSAKPATSPQQEAQIAVLIQGQDRTERAVREEMAKGRSEDGNRAALLRQEVAAALKGINDSILNSFQGISTVQKNQLDAFSTRLSGLAQSNQQQIDQVRQLVEQKLAALQADNAAKLEQMRATVDEKLQGTLEKRLGESFKLVSDRLEQVHRGLGEMQSLATGVGDLKRVLTNVKTRGTWGEVQLDSLLEQVFAPEQYAKNVATVSGSRECVEFAIKFPNRDDATGQALWMPIDAKFPLEDYNRLVQATESADAQGVQEAIRALELRVRGCAKDIAEKYLNPPETTPFGIMYIPTEGLYAEIVRRTDLIELIRRDYRVEVAGPTTLFALLTSYQMGFRTLAIQKRSSEVWGLLATVKSEFGKFGDILDSVHKKLSQASNTIEDAARKSRTIERKLRKVQEVEGPTAEAEQLLLGSESETGDAAATE